MKKKPSLNWFQIFKYYSSKHLLLSISISRHWKQQLMEAGIAEKVPLSFCGFSIMHTEGLTKSRCPPIKINFKFGLTFEHYIEKKDLEACSLKKLAKIRHAIYHRTEDGKKGWE